MFGSQSYLKSLWELIIYSLEISISYISENCLTYIHSYHLYTYIFSFIYLYIYVLKLRHTRMEFA